MADERSTFEGLATPEPKPPLEAPPIQPLFANLLCERDDEKKYTGLLVLPDTAVYKSMTARVVAIGPEVKHVKVGQSILIGRYAGAEIRNFRHREYVVIREDEILGLINEAV